MTKGIWVSPTQFVDFSDTTPDRERLQDEIATRQAAWDWSGFMGLLPDPDPILRKLGDGSEILESLTADGHLIAVIQQRKLGTLKKEFRWEAGLAPGEKQAGSQAAKLAEGLTADLENVDLYNLISALLDAPLYGNTPVEIKWEPKGDRLAIKDIEAKPTRWFSFNEYNEPRFVTMQNAWDGLELPFGKFVLARHFPTYDNPFGLRLLSRCFWPVAFKKGGIKFWTVLAEKYGIPFLLGKHRVGATPLEKQEMLTNLSRMVRDAVAVIAQGGSVEIVETGKAGGGADIHSGLVHEMNAEMSKVIMCQTLTAEVSAQGGSRAQGQVHADILEDVRQGDQTLVKKAMEEIAWLYGLVNAPGIPAPKFVWFEEADPKRDFAERDKLLTDGGVKFQKSHYVKVYGFEEEDFELTTPNPPPLTPLDRGGLKLSPVKGSGEGLVPGTENGKDFAAQSVNPDTADLLAEQLSGQAMAETDKWIEQLRQLTMSATSLEDLRDRIIGLYGDMDPAELGGIIAQAMTLSDCAGRVDVQDETKGV
jgi:phage gp29-like protein